MGTAHPAPMRGKGGVRVTATEAAVLSPKASPERLQTTLDVGRRHLGSLCPMLAECKTNSEVPARRMPRYQGKEGTSNARICV